MVSRRGTFGVPNGLAVVCCGSSPLCVALRLQRGVDGAADQARLPALDLARPPGCGAAEHLRRYRSRDGCVACERSCACGRQQSALAIGDAEAWLAPRVGPPPASTLGPRPILWDSQSRCYRVVTLGCYFGASFSSHWLEPVRLAHRPVRATTPRPPSHAPHGRE
jgi:hypothetical protein